MKETVVWCLLALSLPLPVCAQSSNRSPMVDGDCAEYSELLAEEEKLPFGVRLYFFQNREYVWLCYSLPNGSRGIMDLYIEAPGLPEPLNLHSSAQLGEWNPSDSSGVPREPTSPLWWQVQGWWATTSRFNGYRGPASDRRARLLPSPAREAQFRKERFGRGEWRLRLEISGVATPSGKFETLVFPSGTDGRKLFRFHAS